jgi:transposase
MARGRTHSAEFKLAVVRQVEGGAQRPAQVCREHGIAESLLLRWRKQYAIRGEAAFQVEEPSETERLGRRVAELERFCGQLALENAVPKEGLQSIPSRSGTR